MDIAAGITYAFLFMSLYFEVFMLVVFVERQFAQRRELPLKTQDAVASLPSVAIVVPCFNEANTLESTLTSLLGLEYPKHLLKLIVVDDGSADDTYRVASRIASREEGRMTVLKKENGGKHSAMNLALAHTDAELIGCLDADSIVAHEALKHIVPIFKNARVAAVTPSIQVQETNTWIQQIQHVEYRLSLFNRFMLASMGSVFVTPGPFSIFRTSVVRDLGGWRHGHSTEDMEMGLRMQCEGHLIGNAPGASVHTRVPTDVRTLVRQRIRWTYGWLLNAFDYRHMIGNRRFGDLGIIVLPMSYLSMLFALYFFGQVLWNLMSSLVHAIARIFITGHMPYPSFDLFYFNTSTLFFVIWISIALMLFFIIAGSRIGTGSYQLPLATPLFICCYGLLAPLWLSAAVVRATLKTGVRWR